MNELRVLYVYGPQGKSVHIMDEESILQIPNVTPPSRYSNHYSLTHI